MVDAGEVETVTILGKFNSVNSLAQEDRSSANPKNKYSNFLFIKPGILTEIGALARIQNISISALFIMLSGNSPCADFLFHYLAPGFLKQLLFEASTRVIAYKYPFTPMLLLIALLGIGQGG